MEAQPEIALASPVITSAPAARTAGSSVIKTAATIFIKKPIKNYYRSRTITKLRGWSLVLLISNAIWFLINIAFIVSAFVSIGTDSAGAIVVKWFSIDFSRLFSYLVQGAIALLGMLMIFF